MTIARITELDRRTTQSGKANNGLWLLEFERQKPLRPDPLTGWNGSGRHEHAGQDHFQDQGRSDRLLREEGPSVSSHPAAPVKMKIQAYADNFR